MIVKLPTPTGELFHESFQVELDGIPLTLEYHWQGLREFWKFRLLSSEGEFLVAGCVLGGGLNLFEATPSLKVPTGTCLVLHSYAPGRYDFAEKGVQLVYYSEGEL